MIKSFSENIEYHDERVSTKVILETSFSKEIRILMKQGQIMKEHQAPFPIIVHVLEGAIDFGVQGELHLLIKGDIISLPGKVTHDLKAKQDSVIRLTLSKMDDSERVERVVQS
ncbi:MAG: cupin [Bacteroidetes bacterium]|nr:MAG: cupin [Bacteroidota bacterium]